MPLQYKDIETNEVLFANNAARAYTLFKEGIYKDSMEKLYEETVDFSMSLRERKELKILELKEACTAAMYAGFSSSSTEHSFGFNDHDQSNFTQQLARIGAGAKGNVRWKTKDSGPQEFTTEQFLAIITEAAAHKQGKQDLYWDLEELVLAAEKHEEIHAIKWEE